MRVFPIRIKLANVAAVQRSHDADARKHRRPARRRDQDQRLHGRLPFLGLVFGLRKLRDVVARSSSVTRRRPRGNGIGSSNRRFQPFAALRANVVFPCNQAVGPSGRSGPLLVAALQPCLSGAVMPPHEHVS
jgi:hypothetical protein